MSAVKAVAEGMPISSVCCGGCFEKKMPNSSVVFSGSGRNCPVRVHQTQTAKTRAEVSTSWEVPTVMGRAVMWNKVEAAAASWMARTWKRKHHAVGSVPTGQTTWTHKWVTIIIPPKQWETISDERWLVLIEDDRGLWVAPRYERKSQTWNWVSVNQPTRLSVFKASYQNCSKQDVFTSKICYAIILIFIYHAGVKTGGVKYNTPSILLN